MFEIDPPNDDDPFKGDLPGERYDPAGSGFFVSDLHPGNTDAPLYEDRQPKVYGYLVRIDTEEIREPDVTAIRNSTVTSAESLLGELWQSEAQTTADGRAILRDSTGKTEVDRMPTLSGTAMVGHVYGKSGLHIGTEGNRPVVRLIERDDQTVNVTTVKGEDPLQTAVRGDEWGALTRADRVNLISFERHASTGGDGLAPLERWELTTEGDGDAAVRMYPAATRSEMAGIDGQPAGIPEYEKAKAIVERIRAAVFGA